MRLSSAHILLFFLSMCGWQASASPTCNNPMFSGPNHGIPKMFGEPFVLKTQPSIQTNAHLCKNLNKKLSCCSSATFVPAIQAGKQMDSMIELMQLLLSKATPSALADRFDPQHRFNRDKLEGVISKALGLVSSGIQCFGGYLAYADGLMCLACDPNAARYMEVTSANITLLLTHDTCDGIWSRCSPFVDGALDVVAAAIDLMIDYYEHSNLPPKIKQEKIAELQAVAGLAHVCDTGNCQNLMCTQLLHGLRSANMSINLNGVSSAVQHVQDLMREGDAMALHASTMTYMQVLKQVLSAENLPVFNEYVSGSSGYDAWSVGCSSGKMSSHQCPPPPDSSDDKLSIGAIIGIVVAVLVLAAAAYYVFRRHKQKKTGYQQIAHPGPAQAMQPRSPQPQQYRPAPGPMQPQQYRPAPGQYAPAHHYAQQPFHPTPQQYRPAAQTHQYAQQGPPAATGPQYQPARAEESVPVIAPASE